MIFKRDFEVSAFMSKAGGKIKLPNLVQELIRTFSQAYDTQFDRGLAENQTWVIISWMIDFEKYPRSGDRLTVSTQTPGYRSFLAARHFSLSKGEEIYARGKCLFSVIDKEDRKFSSTFDRLYPEGMVLDSGTIRNYRPRFTNFKPEHRKVFEIRNEDVDGNQHVNNSVYFKWIEEVLPFEVYKSSNYKRVMVQYTQEVVPWGDITLAWSQIDDTYQGLILGAGGEEKAKICLELGR